MSFKRKEAKDIPENERYPVEFNKLLNILKNYRGSFKYPPISFKGVVLDLKIPSYSVTSGTKRELFLEVSKKDIKHMFNAFSTMSDIAATQTASDIFEKIIERPSTQVQGSPTKSQKKAPPEKKPSPKKSSPKKKISNYSTTTYTITGTSLVNSMLKTFPEHDALIKKRKKKLLEEISSRSKKSSTSYKKTSPKKSSQRKLLQKFLHHLLPSCNLKLILKVITSFFQKKDLEKMEDTSRKIMLRLSQNQSNLYEIMSSTKMTYKENLICSWIICISTKYIPTSTISMRETIYSSIRSWVNIIHIL